ncbi:hypothetical protein RXV86_06960 [Alisedimentitalea sp. MJ-SS2]|uniref:hypothetical protein n=1 Tax=Aliisedimentitalea sp. MJ-SS2 TaxID=3049795 RepID=UPI00290C3269|nr:hypothetical protein [Alisedimentitalea sp. MJ-SS2]MDU8927119.1 hypothetical protein [Alisedimentitalea sp. MJ-SS2]
MRSVDRANLILGLGTVVAALLVAFVWVPADVTTGVIEKVRRQVTIGDALAPMLAAGFIGLGGLLVIVFERPENARRITWRNIWFLAVFLIIVALSFAIMRWLGPAMASLIMDSGYRPLRDTAPWKYVGFLVGGAGMITALVSFVEGRVTWRAVLVGLAAAIGLIVVYDLPFDDLLLPPNGDV